MAHGLEQDPLEALGVPPFPVQGLIQNTGPTNKVSLLLTATPNLNQVPEFRTTPRASSRHSEGLCNLCGASARGPLAFLNYLAAPPIKQVEVL